MAVNTACPHSNTVSQSGWEARLQLGFRYNEQRRRTDLQERRHSGPLQVQRPFYPEPDSTCHVYILHPPGGVVGGDKLEISATLESAASVLLTTPAAAKFYRSAGAEALQTQRFQVAADASLEWLPQETIVYRGARLQTTTRIELEANARFIGWEILCLGRPASGEIFDRGRCRQCFEVWHQGSPLFIDRSRFFSDSAVMTACWGLQRQAVCATLVCTTGERELANAELQKLSQQLEAWATSDDLLSISQLQQVFVCRYLGPSSARAKRIFQTAWQQLRPVLLAKTACPPRVWYT